MPRGKRKRTTRLAKQKRLIDARLMEISCEVDKHIFENKPISKSLAVSYLQEITPYREICFRHPRSMQVIEKLIDEMKIIIAEEQEYVLFHDESKPTEFINNREESVPSPVYSLADEDRYVSQGYIDGIVNKDLEANKIVTIDLCSDDNIEEKNVLLDDDICLTQYYIHETVNKDPVTNKNSVIGKATVQSENFEKAISNIMPPNESFLQNSQSILSGLQNSTDYSLTKHQQSISFAKNNVEIRNINYNEKNNICEEININEPSGTTRSKTCEVTENIINNEHNIDIRKKVYFMTPNVCDQSNDVSKFNSTFPIEKRDEPNKIQFKIGDNSETMRINSQDVKVTEPKRRKKRGPNKKKLEGSKNGVNLMKNNRKRFKSTALNKVTDNVTTVTSNNDADIVNISNIGTNKDAPIFTTENKISPMDDKYPNKLPATDTCKTNPQNCLSWLKCIRYVREVDINEYETGLYDETFWANLTFPGNLNEQDFLI